MATATHTSTWANKSAPPNPGPRATADFGDEDLGATVARFIATVQDGGNLIECIDQLLTLVEHHEEKNRIKMDKLANTQETLMRGQILIGKALAQVQQCHTALAKSLQGIQKAQGRTPPSRTPLTPRPLSLADTVKLRREADRVLRLLGPAGGRAVPYDPTLAAALVLQGHMTTHQQTLWKRTGLLSNDIHLDEGANGGNWR